MSDKTTCTSAGTGTPVTTQTIRNRPFVVPQHPVGDPKDPFAKDKIKTQLQQRLNYTSYPNQEQTSLCGPAAFFYCLQKSSPKGYERMVWELWKTGKTSINNLAINVPKQTRRPHSYFRNDNGKPKISGIDWMTLGGLRGSSNTLMAYQSPDDDTSAISTPNEVEEWFTKAGFTLKETFIQNSIHNHQLINKYVKRPNHYVVSLVDSAIISDIRKVKPNVPNHWIVWSSPLAHIDGRAINNGVKDSDKVKMTCFSWGNYNKPLRKNCTYGEFKVLHYMCYIFVK